ncbi:TPA: hypothetical protein HH295_14060 [Xanthomonas vasicola pv. zeae]|uniref:Gylcosyl hydrolase 115 C-terminal domain-containing protein n=1 Tax=Xanthomonas vasicola pv. vasculorum TaxID=325776 RepID=A0AAE8F3S8_XANVA|nr:glycosyl hydrolase 115 family protein [Xanthomonas vasicola]AVQ08770.1 hypothetical protein C7V42_21405 [Xanthomonas vasicola pv. vasculorum]AZM73018.1 hypothetical protein CXP37_21705 [Xanthomonas vasicola pv. vasculorum]KEZ98355.1 hypothetical protein A11M_0106295 [Xanthomonas vasicola pv. vasculorum NCPPB 895]MBV7304331.1 glycosyl hydrolase 115 family protein [Xanthomonas vasicola pv. vasculorum]MDO6935504.1 glycosyl hydrolase 115 family protein [Xanthomonas vasicola]
MSVPARTQTSSIAPLRARSLLIIAIGLFAAGGAWACNSPVSVCERDSAGAVALIRSEVPATVVVDASADLAVRSVADNFAADLQRVAGRNSGVTTDLATVRGTAVIVGTLGQSPFIDALIAGGKIDRGALLQRWEAYTQIVVDHPTPQIDRALVIVGADRRGAVFGTYDVSEKIGVSPWYWFADVATAHRSNLFITRGSVSDAPKVRYRGFFINDEDPALKGWATKKFGGVNAKMYAYVFELGLRMKANYLWPAMWGKAFNVDDPDNMVLADQMGIVMGTSHHEPMMRAQKEWHLKSIPNSGGAWDYTSNAANLRAFWKGGIARMMSKGDGQRYDSLVTIGMRGDGDEPMAESTASHLLEQVVADQRAIIAEVTQAPATQTPQVWALYKEVQDYYDHGMQVPDDVTLLFSDDNWGQIRRLPVTDLQRAGGYGVYYHFDYVGVPRNYKWINTNQIEKIWQQMNLAYQRGARQLWVVNVGDIKPMEYPLSFFLRMAWNPEAMTPGALAAYPQQWAQASFGTPHAAGIGALMTRYSTLVARRKPELIDQDTFALGEGAPARLDGGEFGAIVAEWQALEQRMLGVKTSLPADQHDAYYQLIEYPIAAVANLYQLYYAAAWNKRLAARNDARANYFADMVETTFQRDQALTQRYHTINGGKWDGMMNQVHMSYVTWNDPTQQSMPLISRVGGDTPPDRIARSIAFAPPAAQTPGVIAIEAPMFSRVTANKGLQWTTIPALGRTQGAVVALPQGKPATAAEDRVAVEYDVVVTTPGTATLGLYLAPTLDTSNRGPLRLGVSIDHGPVTTVSSDLQPTGGAQKLPAEKAWATAVQNNVVFLSAQMGVLAKGRHTIKVVRIDDNIVLQKLVLSTVPVPASYLGPAPTH